MRMPRWAYSLLLLGGVGLGVLGVVRLNEKGEAESSPDPERPKQSPEPDSRTPSSERPSRLDATDPVGANVLEEQVGSDEIERPCAVERRPKLQVIQPSATVSGADQQPRGGRVSPGRYVLEAFSPAPGRTARPWAAELILRQDGTGEYLRRLGLTNHGSEITWTANLTAFTFTTTCPDPGEQQTFRYSASADSLHLWRADGEVFTLSLNGSE